VTGSDPGLMGDGYLRTNPFRLSRKTYSGPKPRPLSICFCCPSPPGIHRIWEDSRGRTRHMLRVCMGALSRCVPVTLVRGHVNHLPAVILLCRVPWAPSPGWSRGAGGSTHDVLWPYIPAAAHAVSSDSAEADGLSLRHSHMKKSGLPAYAHSSGIWVRGYHPAYMCCSVTVLHARALSYAPCFQGKTLFIYSAPKNPLFRSP